MVVMTIKRIKWRSGVSLGNRLLKELKVQLKEKLGCEWSLYKEQQKKQRGFVLRYAIAEDWIVQWEIPTRKK